MSANELSIFEKIDRLNGFISQNLPLDSIVDSVRTQLLKLESGFEITEFILYLETTKLAYLLKEDIFCSECQIRCSIAQARNDNWWIDRNDKLDHRDNPKIAHLCNHCQQKSLKQYFQGNLICTRCSRRGEYGQGKWCVGDESTGRFWDCASCGDICYKCHDRIHYNK